MPVTRSFGVFLICTWTHGWANNRDADLRPRRPHYDGTAMHVWRASCQIRGSRHSTRGAESACCISGDWTLRKLLTVRMQNASSLSFLVDKQCHVYLNREYVYRLLLNFSSESSFVRYCWDIFHAQQFAQPAIGLGHEDINSIWNNVCKYLSTPKSLLISVNCSSIYYIDRSRFYLWESGNGECALWTATVKPTQHLADTHSGWPT